MYLKDYRIKNKDIENLFEKIYLSKNIWNIYDIFKFIEIIIYMTDKGGENKPDAAYIITDILLKYDDDDILERVFDISGPLEVVENWTHSGWTQEDIDKEWEKLKQIFFEIKANYVK